MPITSRQVLLVQTSFGKVIRDIDLAATYFYEQMFELDPALRALFKHDILSQGRKLIHTLLLIVNNLEEPANLIPTVETLARNHLKYGVKESYYPTAGKALIATIKHAMADEYTTEIESAW